jgi:hypothetical protein
MLCSGWASIVFAWFSGAAASGKLKEAFACGTAAVVASIRQDQEQRGSYGNL